MITNQQDRFNKYVESKLERELIILSKNQLTKESANEKAKDIASKIDWNNSALMHKGFTWMAKNYMLKTSTC